MTSLDVALKTVKKLADKLKRPDEDIPPVVIVVTPWEAKTFDARTGSDAEKAHLFQRKIPDFVFRTKARAVIHVSMAWYAPYRPPDGAEEPYRDDTGMVAIPAIPASEDPDRQEVLVVSEVTAASTSLYFGRVVRSTNLPPLIEPLEPWPDEAEAYLLRHVQRALKSVRG